MLSVAWTYHSSIEYLSVNDIVTESGLCSLREAWGFRSHFLKELLKFQAEKHTKCLTSMHIENLRDKTQRATSLG